MLADQGSEGSALRPSEAPHFTLSCKIAHFRSVTFYRATNTYEKGSTEFLTSVLSARLFHARSNDFNTGCDRITWKWM